MPALAARLHERLETSVFRLAMAQPPRMTRRLAGPPKRMDGMTLSPQTQLLLRLQKWARERPAETLPIEQGRRSIVRQATMAGGRQPIGDVVDTSVRGAEGPLAARLYVPRGAAPVSPLLVFFHGGGMIYGNLDSHDAVCRFLAEQTGRSTARTRPGSRSAATRRGAVSRPSPRCGRPPKGCRWRSSC